MEYWSNCVIFS